MRIWQQERFILDITERICGMMNDQGMTRKELAKRIGKNPKFISKLLDNGNQSIRTISDIFNIFGRAIMISDVSLTKSIKKPYKRKEIKNSKEKKR